MRCLTSKNASYTETAAIEAMLTQYGDTVAFFNEDHTDYCWYTFKCVNVLESLATPQLLGKEFMPVNKEYCNFCCSFLPALT